MGPAGQRCMSSLINMAASTAEETRKAALVAAKSNLNPKGQLHWLLLRVSKTVGCAEDRRNLWRSLTEEVIMKSTLSNSLKPRFFWNALTTKATLMANHLRRLSDGVSTSLLAGQSIERDGRGVLKWEQCGEEEYTHETLSPRDYFGPRTSLNDAAFRPVDGGRWWPALPSHPNPNPKQDETLNPVALPRGTRDVAVRYLLR